MKKLAFSALGMLCAGIIAVSAQTMNSGYFLDNYNFGYTINPAYQPEKETNVFFGLLINGLTVNSMSNIGLSSLVYPVNGQLVYGLNKAVPADVFLGNLKDINQVKASINQNLLNFGIRTSEKGFLNFDVSLKGVSDNTIPKSFFEMLKRGVKDNDSYTATDINSWLGTYFEFALGYSHKIGDKISVGARAKLLMGVAMFENHIDKMTVRVESNKNVYGSGYGNLAIACPSISLIDENEVIKIDNIKFGTPGVAGWGFGFDIGATYCPIEDLAIDLAIQNIGKITWNRNINGVMNYTDRSLSTGDIELEDILEYKKDNTKEKISTSLPTTYRIGAKYHMPFYRPLSVRALGTIISGGHYNCTDIRVGATVTPVKQVSATINYGYTTYGSTCGAAVNFNLGFFNLFIGADSVFHKITPQFLPVNAYYLTYNAGVTFQIKKKY